MGTLEATQTRRRAALRGKDAGRHAMPTSGNAGPAALSDALGRQHGAAHGCGAGADAGEQGDAWAADAGDAATAAGAAGVGCANPGGVMDEASNPLVCGYRRCQKLSAATAKPSPVSPRTRETITPIRLPRASSSAPPEEPGAMVALV